MFKIYDGRAEFYQWDLDRKIVVSDPAISEVHFCNKTDDCSLVVEVYELDGQRVANVPNVLLQNNWDIRVYGYCGSCYTKQAARFKVVARTKPADYIYTETEIKTFDGLEKRMDELEYQYSEEGIKATVNDYLENSLELDPDNLASKPEVAAVEEIANAANEKADNAVQALGEALATANQANETANEAKALAQSSQSVANEAKEIAQNSQQVVNDTKEIVQDVQEVVNEAKETSQSAQSVATEAKEMAQNAQSVANEAKETADGIAGVTSSALDIANTAFEQSAAAKVQSEESAVIVAEMKEDVDAFFADADLTENAKDTLKEIQEYINTDASAAAEMVNKIAELEENKADLDALNDYVPKIDATYKGILKTWADNGEWGGWITVQSNAATAQDGFVAKYMVETNGDNEAKGYLLTATPTRPYQSANKKYVDDNFVASKTSEEPTGKWVYGINNSENRLFYTQQPDGGKEIGDTTSNGAIPIYNMGCLSGRMPTNPYHYTPKKYVDDNFMAKNETTTNFHQVYAKLNDGTTHMFDVGAGAAYAIPLTDESGRLPLNEPLASNHPVTVSYADAHYAPKLYEHFITFSTPIEVTQGIKIMGMKIVNGSSEKFLTLTSDLKVDILRFGGGLLNDQDEVNFAFRIIGTLNDSVYFMDLRDGQVVSIQCPSAFANDTVKAL